ncbi:MAG: spore germination protein GerW family protein [Christensenellales bacterium]
MNDIQQIMSAALDSLKGVVESDATFSKPITMPDGTTIVPMSKITIGIASGGGEINKNKEYDVFNMPFAGGGGGGITITPLGFLVCADDSFRMVKIEDKEKEERWKDLISLATKVIKR